MLRDAALYFGSLVLKPNLHAPGGHAQLVSELYSRLLVGHLISLKDLLQDCKLVWASPLPLLLVEGVTVVLSTGKLDPMKLEQDHGQ